MCRTYLCVKLVQTGDNSHPLSRLKGVQADGAALRLDDAVGRRLPHQEGWISSYLSLTGPDCRRHLVVLVQVQEGLVVWQCDIVDDVGVVCSIVGDGDGDCCR